MSVDFNDANKAWAKTMGLTYPLLSDMRRQMSSAYDVLFNDVTMAGDPKKVPIFLRTKRAWFVIDKEGVIRYAKITGTRELVPSDELLQVLRQL